VFPVGVAG